MRMLDPGVGQIMWLPCLPYKGDIEHNDITVHRKITFPRSHTEPPTAKHATSLSKVT